MKIRGWHIDGFGPFLDYRIADIQDGLTVFLGPNEAGKTTLLAFLRGELFGFPDRRNRVNLYPPLRGGRHGGRLILEGNDGIYIIERSAASRKAPRITRPDGSKGTEEDLRRLTGGVDEKLFRNIFAFSLTELMSLDTLTREGAQERVFSAGISGAGSSVMEATKALKTAETKLFTPRGGQINNLITRLQENQQKRREAEELAGQYADLIDRERLAREKVNSLRQEIEASREHERSLHALLDLCPRVRSAMDKLKVQLSELEISPVTTSPEEPLTFTFGVTLDPELAKAEAELAARDGVLKELRSALVELRDAGAELSSVRQVARERKEALREAKSGAGAAVTGGALRLLPHVVWGFAALLIGGAVLGLISRNVSITSIFAAFSLLACGVAVLLTRSNERESLGRKEYLERLGTSLAAATAELELVEGKFRSMVDATRSRATELGFEESPSLEDVEEMALLLAKEKEKVMACRELQHRLQDLEAQARRLLYGIEAPATQPAATPRQGSIPAAESAEEVWKRSRQELLEWMESLQRKYDDAIREHRDIQKSLESLETSTTLADLAIEEAVLRAELEDAARRWRVNALAGGLLRETLAEYEKTRQPKILQNAGDLFRSITGGRYVQVIQPSGANTFEVITGGGERLGVENLSRGTQEQLYLSVRLGLALDFAHRVVALPLIMDDILVNFDPRRAEATASALANIALELQVLFFTCHPETSELFQKCAPGCRIVELDGPAASC